MSVECRLSATEALKERDELANLCLAQPEKLGGWQLDWRFDPVGPSGHCLYWRDRARLRFRISWPRLGFFIMKRDAAGWWMWEISWK